jgi:hypothetical protein
MGRLYVYHAYYYIPQIDRMLHASISDQRCHCWNCIISGGYYAEL